MFIYIVFLPFVDPLAASEQDIDHGIRRAESCDSVESDSSLLDVHPVSSGIGQIELALEYDKLV